MTHYIPIRRRISSAVTPATRITLFRLVSPDAMVTEERGTSKRFAKNSIQASFARPSTGGAVKASFSASPNSPVMAFFLARGWTLIAKVTPTAVSRIGIMNSIYATESQRHRELQPSELADSVEVQRIPAALISSVTPCLCGDYLLGLSPKIAVPTRTQVEPSSIATSKSCDIPIESVLISTAGNRRAAICSRNSRSFRK